MGTAREIIRSKKCRAGGPSRLLSVTFPNLCPAARTRIKYRLFCGRPDGTCLVRYDNERGKGDHRHIGDTEKPYVFTTLLELVEDFEADIERI